ncbi:hypothetical protein, partial [Escherichia coli]|uniref:hypothetical protein n=1 Tax=Escherichia coli TaxID=562 RepID=UPI00190B0B25
MNVQPLAVTLTPMPMDLLLLAALSAQASPPIRTATGERQFLQWVAEDARCGGEPLRFHLGRVSRQPRFEATPQAQCHIGILGGVAGCGLQIDFVETDRLL